MNEYVTINLQRDLLSCSTESVTTYSTHPWKAVYEPVIFEVIIVALRLDLCVCPSAKTATLKFPYK